MTDFALSRVTVRTIDGLRVALAGLPPAMRVLPLQDGADLGAATVGELRAWTALPHPLDVFVPYRLIATSVVVVGEHDPNRDLG